MLYERASYRFETQEKRFLQRISLLLYVDFDTEDCSNYNVVDNDEDDADLQEFDEDTDQIEQIFNFIIISPFDTFFFGSTIEPLYFV